MKFIQHALFVAALVLTAPAWAVNKCTDQAGKVSYQNGQCPVGKSEEIKLPGSTAQVEPGAYGGQRQLASSSSLDTYFKGPTHESDRMHKSGSSTVHTGPRGGRYTIGPSGNKNYIPRGKR